MDVLPVGSELFFNIDAVRKQYSWSDVASKYAQECIDRLDAGADAQDVQYSIVRGRASGLSWAYGGTDAMFSPYVVPTQSELQVVRKRVRTQVVHREKNKEASSSSSQVLSASTSRGRKGRRSDARADEGEVVTKSSTEKRSIEGDSRRVRRASAKEAVVDLVSDTSEVGEDDLACSSATSIGNLEEF